jgi:predicted Rossmann fold nucleotide-binding protein DprA/Smf involved in DNA uptake
MGKLSAQSAILIRCALFAIPTPIRAARWLGGSALIRPGAKIVRSIGDFNSLCSFVNTYANLRRSLIVRRCIDKPKWGNYPLNLRF